ncbi:MAG: HEAT repeat domain-containing protein [Nocardioides sp.]
MARASVWGVTPREHIASECARLGKDTVVANCLAILDGAIDPAPEVLRSVAGPGAEKYFDGAEHEDTYWFRVWALRGLLWAWDARASDHVCAALRDEHWRVREMAVKVVARHLVADATPAVAVLRDDPVPRVQAAAERALFRLSTADGGGS